MKKIYYLSYTHFIVFFTVCCCTCVLVHIWVLFFALIAFRTIDCHVSFSFHLSVYDDCACICVHNVCCYLNSFCPFLPLSLTCYVHSHLNTRILFVTFFVVCFCFNGFLVFISFYSTLLIIYAKADRKK